MSLAASDPLSPQTSLLRLILGTPSSHGGWETKRELFASPRKQQCKIMSWNR